MRTQQHYDDIRTTIAELKAQLNGFELIRIAAKTALKNGETGAKELLAQFQHDSMFEADELRRDGIAISGYWLNTYTSETLSERFESENWKSDTGQKASVLLVRHFDEVQKEFNFEMSLGAKAQEIPAD